jgi:hypothetical protein
LLFFVGAAAMAEPPPKKSASDKPASHFMRLARDKSDAPLALETAIVHCAPAGKNADPQAPTVDLVAAVHVADADYYRKLNHEFEGYDAVLYELVAPESAKTPRPTDPANNHPITLLQNGLKDVLELEFQLKGIDYTRKNMIHADMSPDQFYQSMQDRGESMLSMLARMMGYALAKQGQAGGEASGWQWMAALFDKDRALALKRLMADEFVNSEDMMSSIEGPKGSTLISGRNQVALVVLRKEIAGGKKKIAIFYGAGHMPDFLKRLHDDFGLTPVDTRWLAAWNLQPKTKNASNVKQP